MDFEKWIDEKVKDQKVLEVGGVGDYEKYFKNNFIKWRHNRLKSIAREIVGGDIEKNGIAFVNKNGFDYRYFNIEDTNISDETGKFDRILLLDVIEHLNNIGNGLENIKNYMHKDTEFIISTPNPMSFNNIVRTLFGKKLNTLEDHTVWMDESNFKQFAKRYGYVISEVHYFTFNPKGSLKQFIVNIFGNFNKYFHQNFVVVLKKVVNKHD
ncbi:class I SAM-dependent methyltransferase [Aliarcobacter cryaerophilus]|uniref:class I SAM-dependent methyltransferase n=1 Tax=Aliarcobacter cryaerophilus TaxID=28198 RepID=UPI0021B6C9EC|nr:class I SAM-dependent methyltransferase [Aliarcobacter cryaerophilus]MCT7460920.1 class I SAM-dependent methyltransferase [Aliarcobacter cryaerophilus]